MTPTQSRALDRGRRLAGNLAVSVDDACAAAQDLGRQLADASALAQRLDRDPGLSRDLDRDHRLAEALVRALGDVRRLTYELARDPIFGPDTATTADVAVDRARSRVSSVEYGLDRARAQARTLAPALDLDRTHARRLAPVLDTPLDRARARGLALDVDIAPRRARNIAGSATDAQWLCHRLLDWAASVDVNPAAMPQRRRAWAAGRLADAAVRALPPPHRARYREEYRSELFDLATMGVSRWGQLLYAARLLDRAWLVRAELRTPWARRVKS